MQQKFLTNLQSPTQFIQQPQQFQTQSQNPNAGNANASISGPPINSLYDNLRNEKSFQTPTKSFYHPQQSVHQDTPTLNRSGFNQSRIMSPIPNTMHSDFNNSYSYQNMAYPVAVQPSFNQSIRSQDFWITVFGFPSTSTSIVLAHFSGVGTILEKVCSSGNWIHLRYCSRGECDKALLYNGKIIGNNLMIGVIRCQDESVLDKENQQNESQQQSISRIRSLTQAGYKSARQESEVIQTADDPKKTTGIVSRVVDSLFGW